MKAAASYQQQENLFSQIDLNTHDDGNNDKDSSSVSSFSDLSTVKVSNVSPILAERKVRSRSVICRGITKNPHSHFSPSRFTYFLLATVSRLYEMKMSEHNQKGKTSRTCNYILRHSRRVSHEQSCFWVWHRSPKRCRDDSKLVWNSHR